MINPISIIVLAAGSSSRMGKSKQLLDINGDSLLRHSIKVALSSEVIPVVVVLGANEQDHSKIIEDLPVEITINREWEKGMGSSIKKGIKHLLEINPDAGAAIFMVCDQPMISSNHITKLIQEYRSSTQSIIASFYQNTPGVPVLFGKEHFQELLDLDDSQGAKKIITKHKDTTMLIDFPEGAMDLDTPDDYKQFIAHNSKLQ